MGNQCVCCRQDDHFLSSKDLWELSELMKDQNKLIRQDDIIEEINFPHKISSFISQSEEYILIFHSVPNNKLSFEEFTKIRQSVHECYTSIFNNNEKEFDIYTKELRYLIKIKLVVSLGLKIVY